MVLPTSEVVVPIIELLYKEVSPAPTLLTLLLLGLFYPVWRVLLHYASDIALLNTFIEIKLPSGDFEPSPDLFYADVWVWIRSNSWIKEYYSLLFLFYDTLLADSIGAAAVFSLSGSERLNLALEFFSAVLALLLYVCNLI